MKFIAVLFLAIFALISSSVALKNDICGVEYNDGMCLAYIPSWTYKADTNECILFVYGGCGGNRNRFNTKKDCEKMCKE